MAVTRLLKRTGPKVLGNETLFGTPGTDVIHPPGWELVETDILLGGKAELGGKASIGQIFRFF